MGKIKAKKVLFIKLGRNGKFEEECIKHNLLKLSYTEVNHELCLNGQWEDVHDFYVYQRSESKSTATMHTNQIKKFYEEDENTLWITFYSYKLWWCFSKPEITQLSDNTKTRPVIGKWSDEDINGNILIESNISGKLLKTKGFRATICNVPENLYTLDKINGEQHEGVLEVEKAMTELKTKLIVLIQDLRWQDFETLIDLIFRQAGWQRLIDVGKTHKTIDIELLSPVTGERAMVQIKSSSNLKEYLYYQDQFAPMHNEYEKFFFVVHTATKDLSTHRNDSDINLYLVDKIAELSISSGLVNWIIKKVS